MPGAIAAADEVQYRLELIPVEEDLLSLEMDDVARDIYLVSYHIQKFHVLRPLADFQNGDDTPIYYSSLALMTFQRAYGLFPRILGKGNAAKVCLSKNINLPELTSAETGRPSLQTSIFRSSRI
jgi:hypothetical protein